MKFIDYLLAALVLFAAALVTIILINLMSLSKYQECLSKPISELSGWCKNEMQNKN